MKITMLGTMSIGKTTFMTAMYEILGRRGFKGFKLTTDRSLDVLLGKYWRDMYVHGTWPLSTTDLNIKRMVFNLYYKDQYITDFNFIDYRGGAIDDPDQNKPDVDQLYQDILASNSVMILADSWYIVNAEDRIIAEEHNQINNIQNLIEDFCKKHSRKALSVAVVLTKIDSVNPEEHEKLRQNCLELFSRLGEIVTNSGSRLRGAFIPVSVAGYGNTKIEVAHPGKVFGKPVVSSELINRPQPENIHVPLLYCIRGEIENQVVSKQSVIEGKEYSAERAFESGGLFNELGSWISGKESQWDKGNRLVGERNQEVDKYNEAIIKLKPLLDEVGEIPEFASERIYNFK